MTALELPLLIDPEVLHERLPDERLLVLDLAAAEQFAEGHIPGAINLPYGRIVRHDPPVAGLLPERRHLQALYDQLGLDTDTDVVALDREGGAAAGRLLWTLHGLGHARCAMLDGGLHAWSDADLPLTRDATPPPRPSGERGGADGGVIADHAYIRERLDDPGFRLLDARSIGEYDGSTRRAARGGHIPGARHYEWSRGIDPATMRMRPAVALLQELAGLDITPAHEVVVYCHSHHRSGFSYWMLRTLGFERVRGYPGSWSDWGNRPDTPIETLV